MWEVPLTPDTVFPQLPAGTRFLLLDTEGLGSYTQSETYDVQVSHPLPGGGCPTTSIESNHCLDLPSLSPAHPDALFLSLSPNFLLLVPPKLFSLALLLSSYFIYNSVGQIDEGTIEKLSSAAPLPFPHPLHSLFHLHL